MVPVVCGALYIFPFLTRSVFQVVCIVLLANRTTERLIEPMLTTVRPPSGGGLNFLDAMYVTNVDITLENMSKAKTSAPTAGRI